ncbi:hypothetical protein TRIATDRAFT_301657 [Trichoderma atroviride IMI 206040]|uniref:Uncharacterized protein n=1 Tax=Hypocrea atroviridis (strain ATCC 20476 / IMI 206040) TaxID=452589 RepID=G9P8D7_HYPAI|nr:uncharacterized protein TRIATDRAFT_301657 [Trichoderma atroviride IMI 206040]EHK40930.1 hypothetical protein TRIATDRAFT_301657 [Trichoderma atroviride IMI 206040]
MTPSPLLGPEARIDIPSLRNLALFRATDDNPSLFDRLLITAARCMTLKSDANEMPLEFNTDILHRCGHCGCRFYKRRSPLSALAVKG